MLYSSENRPAVSEQQSSLPTPDYDTLWKEVVQKLFPDMLALLFPEIHQAIDWGQPYEFLNVELPKLLLEAPGGSRRPDIVAKVRLQSGEPILVVLHVEIQVSQDPNFAERMFIYFYHLRERDRLPVLSLAILADANRNWHPKRYEYRLFNTSVQFEYETVKLLELDENQLRESTNPTALFVLAHLATLKHRGNYELMANEKRWLFRKMLEGGYNATQIRYLFKVVDYFMNLPPELEREVDAIVEEVRRKQKRSWLSPWERRVLERGARKGLMDGLQQGLQQGIQQGLRKAIQANLEVRFGQIPVEVLNLIQQVSRESELDKLLRQSIQVESLEQFKALLREALQAQSSGESQP